MFKLIHKIITELNKVVSLCLFKSLNSLRKLFYNDDLQKKTSKSIFWSLLNNGLVQIIGFFTLPLTLNYLDSTKYGVWTVVNGIVLYLGLFDFGIGNGLRNHLSSSFVNKDFHKAKVFISTAYTLIAISMSIIVAMFLIVNIFIDWGSFLNVSEITDENLSLIVAIVVVTFAIKFVLNLIKSIMISRNDFFYVAILDTITIIIMFIGIVILKSYTAGSLFYLCVTFSSIGIIPILFLSIYFFRTKYIEFSPSVFFFDIKKSKELFTLSGKFFILQISNLLLFFSNSIIIIKLLGPQEVTTYNIIYKLFFIMIAVFVTILNPFWTAINQAKAINDFNWISLTIKKMKLLFFFFVCAIFILVLSTPTILYYWVGFQEYDLMLIALLGTYSLINSWNNLFIYIANAFSKITLQTVTYSSMAILIIPLSIFFIKYLNFGTVGMALSMVVITLPGAFLFPYQVRLLLNNKAYGVFSK